MIIAAFAVMQRLILACLALLCYIACRRDASNELKINLESIKVLEHLPSGSGMAVVGDSVFIVGDDASALFVYFPASGRLNRIPLLQHDSSVHRIPKPGKHDLECMTKLEWEGRTMLLAFGSGSLRPQRERMLLIDPAKPRDHAWLAAAGLYDQLRELSAAKEINIEGVVAGDSKIYLMNRSGNEIFSLPLQELEKFIRSKGNYRFRQLSVHKVQVPPTESGQPSISGGCLLPDGYLLFCASVEETPNAYEDGRIRGSYIGILDTAGFQIAGIAMLADEEGQMLVQKLESLDLWQPGTGDVRKIIAISDNDDGQSTLLFISILK